MKSVICHLLSFICLLRKRQTGLYRRPTPWRRQPTMESVICHLISVICRCREETDRAVQKANTLEAAAKKRSNLLSVILYLLSVCCREETDRAVQKANTLEAAANDGICYLSSYICYPSAAGKRQTGLYRRQTPWRQ
jgi:hypothetical protein